MDRRSARTRTSAPRAADRRDACPMTRQPTRRHAPRARSAGQAPERGGRRVQSRGFCASIPQVSISSDSQVGSSRHASGRKHVVDEQVVVNVWGPSFRTEIIQSPFRLTEALCHRSPLGNELDLTTIASSRRREAVGSSELRLVARKATAPPFSVQGADSEVKAWLHDWPRVPWTRCSSARPDPPRKSSSHAGEAI